MRYQVSDTIHWQIVPDKDFRIADMISSIQSRMARAALGWGTRDLAAQAKVSTDTIARLERGEKLRERTLDDIRRALEAAGIEFVDDPAKPGVLLRSTVRTSDE